MTVNVKMSKLPDQLEGVEVECGWCSEKFLYENLLDHVHFKGVAEVDFSAETKKVLPVDDQGIPIYEDPSKKVAIYMQERPDPPDNFLNGITSVSVAIIKCVEKQKGLYDPTLKWDPKVKKTAYDVIALNINENLKLNESDKLTGQMVKTKWENLRKGFSRNINTYQYAANLQFVKKYLRATHAEIEDQKENCKRKTPDDQSNVSGGSKRIRIKIGSISSASHQPGGSGDSCEDETLSEGMRNYVQSGSTSKGLAAAKEASLSFLHKSSQLQSLENKVTSAAKITLKQATDFAEEQSSGSLLNQKNWSNHSLTIREALLTAPHENLLSLVNGILKIMKKYMKSDD